MKRTVVLALAILLVMGLFAAPAALALGEDWEVLRTTPEGPFYEFDDARGIAVDASGNIYVSEMFNHRVKRYTSDGMLDTAWGGGDGIIGSIDGDAPHKFYEPMGLALDASGRLYVADSGNGRIVRYTAAGEVDSAWGTDGYADGLFNPTGVAVDASGNIYVSEPSNHRIKRLTSAGALDTTWDGDGMIGTYGTGDDQFNNPNGLAVDAAGNLYVADTYNHRVKRYTSAGVLDTTWDGGDGIVGSYGSGNDQFGNPNGLVVDAAGRLYVADQNNHRIVRYTSAAAVDTSFGTQGSGTGEMRSPADVTVDTSGNVYVADTSNERISRYLPALTPDTSWGTDGSIGKYGTGPDQYQYARYAAVDSEGRLYVSDSDNHRIKRFAASGALDASWGAGGILGGTEGSAPDEFNNPYGLVFDAAGNLYIADTGNHRIKRYTSAGVLDISWGGGDGIIGTGTQGSGADEFDVPKGLAVDAAGNLYVADTDNHRIKRYTSAGALDTSWATGGMFGTNGSGANQFDSPYDVIVDASENFYVSDRHNDRVLRYTSACALDTGWGENGILGGVEGTGTGQFDNTYALELDNENNLYVCDYKNNRIKRYTSGGTLDAAWFDGGIWQSAEGLASTDCPLDRPSGVAYFGTRLYSVWRNRIVTFVDVESALKLSGLTVDGEAVSGFDPETLEYTVVVSKSAASVQIGTDTMSPYSSVSGDGTQALDSGNCTELPVTITAETGDTQVYTVNVLREGSVGLASLSVDGKVVSGFSEDKTSYRAYVPYGSKYANVTAVGNSGCSEITGTGIVTLTGSRTTVTVIAKAGDGSAREYTLTIKTGSKSVETVTEEVTLSLDGRLLSLGGITVEVSPDGQTMMLWVTAEDGTVNKYPIELVMEEVPEAEPAAEEEPAPDTGDAEPEAEVEKPPEEDAAEIETGTGDDEAAPAPFPWWWILVGVFGMASIGLGAWVFVLKRK